MVAAMVAIRRSTSGIFLGDGGLRGIMIVVTNSWHFHGFRDMMLMDAPEARMDMAMSLRTVE
jgi:hypothetical protein